MQKRDPGNKRKRISKSGTDKKDNFGSGKRINKSRPDRSSDDKGKSSFKKKFDSKSRDNRSSDSTTRPDRKLSDDSKSGYKKKYDNKSRDNKTSDSSVRPERKYTDDSKSGYKKKYDSKKSDSSSSNSDSSQRKTIDSKKKSFKKDYDSKKKGSPKTLPEKSIDDNKVRLNKFIANAGICSRREADDYIKAGVVTVNGKVVTEMGSVIEKGDEVKFNNEKIRTEKKVYLLLNKPKNYVSTLADPHADKTVMDLVKNACPERIYPVGRLDKSTTGLLLFTNDGDLAKRLTHPKYKKKKIYQVTLDKNVTKTNILDIGEGIELDDGFIQADAVNYADPVDKKIIGIEIHSGKNRIVRRIFEHFGYNVLKLDRVYFAGLTKKNLPRGKWRFLSDKEINMLNMNAFA